MSTTSKLVSSWAIHMRLAMQFNGKIITLNSELSLIPCTDADKRCDLGEFKLCKHLFPCLSNEDNNSHLEEIFRGMETCVKR